MLRPGLEFAALFARVRCPVQGSPREKRRTSRAVLGRWLVAVSVGVIVPASASQAVTENAKVVASDGTEDDHFGYSIAMDGDTAVIGAQGFSDISGAAYVFRFDGRFWVEEAMLTASDPAELDNFGRSVSVAGDTAMVGAEYDDDDGSASGSVYVFLNDGTTWVEEVKLTASDAAANDRFGISVALAGDTAVIGAFGDDDNGSASGSAYVFHYDGTSWVEEVKLTASDGAAGDRFGWSAAFDGDTAVVGAYFDDDASGSAYVFRYDGTVWVEEAKLTASDAGTFQYFGRGVAVAGDTAVVGAQGDDDNGFESGAAYIFRYDGASWVEEVKLTASDASESARFGREVAIAGDTVVVGSQYDDLGGVRNFGSAYVFRYDGTAWVEEFKLKASDPTESEQFGNSVAIVGETALIGAYLDDENGMNSGSVYVFELDALKLPSLSPLGVATLLGLLGLAGWWTLRS